MLVEHTPYPKEEHKHAQTLPLERHSGTTRFLLLCNRFGGGSKYGHHLDACHTVHVKAYRCRASD